MPESANVLSWIGITVSGRTLNNLRYEDDIVLIANTPRQGKYANSHPAVDR